MPKPTTEAMRAANACRNARPHEWPSIIDRETRQPALIEALKWYAEKARALHRYGQKPIKPEAMEAVVTEMMLDAGNHARAALKDPR